MTVREYIGARYVPKFSDPIEWDDTKTYEPLTIVYYQGNSYTSRQSVPVGIQITNETYWALTGNYNVQIEQYRTEVQAYTAGINTLNDALPIVDFNANNTVKDAIDAVGALLPDTYFTSENTVKDAIDSVNTDITAIKADSWVTTNRIADNAVTTDKIATNAITENKLSNDEQANIGNHLVFIGDSWAEGYTPDGNVTSFFSLVENELEPQGYVINSHYAGGAGFITGTTYNQQLVTLAGQMTENERYQVSDVIISGGWNDNAQTNIGTWESAINTLDTTVKTNFPNASWVYNWVGNGDWAKVDSAGQTAINNMYTAFKNCYQAMCNVGKGQLICGLKTLLRTQEWASDGVHPNAQGQRVLAKQLINVIKGYPFYSKGNISDISTTIQGSHTVSSNGIKVSFNAEHCINSNLENSSMFIKGDASFSSDVAVTLNGGAVVSLKLQPNDTLNLFPYNSIDFVQNAVIQLNDNNSQSGGTFFSVPFLCHLIRSGSDILITLYGLQTNTGANTNYLSGKLKQLQFKLG